MKTSEESRSCATVAYYYYDTSPLMRFYTSEYHLLPLDYESDSTLGLPVELINLKLPEELADVLAF
jgi:hypothetical protein